VWDGDSKIRKPRPAKATTCSKPTVWDGDSLSEQIVSLLFPSSKPTVWDGDAGGTDGVIHMKALF